MASPKLPKGGVYVIRNNIDDRIYIGSTNNLGIRWAGHRNHLKKGLHSYAFQTFWNEHKDKIELYFSAIEHFPDKSTRDYRQRREQYWLDYFRPYDPGIGFNTNFHPDGARGVARRPESIALTASKNRGRKRPPEFGEAVRQRMLGKTYSTERRANIAAAKRGGPCTNGLRALTNDAAAEIRLLYGQGNTAKKDLGRMFGVSFEVVDALIRGETYVIATDQTPNLNVRPLSMLQEILAEVIKKKKAERDSRPSTKRAYGPRPSRRKFSCETAERIRSLHAQGATAHELCKRFDAGWNTIKGILNGTLYRAP